MRAHLGVEFGDNGLSDGEELLGMTKVGSKIFPLVFKSTV